MCIVGGASTTFWNTLITSWYQHIVTVLCLVTTNSAIKFVLHENHVAQGQQGQAIPLNLARYKKAVYSALWEQVILVICYLPYNIAIALSSQKEMSLSTYLAIIFTGTTVSLNSSLNPLLYCWKIREVRQAVKEALRNSPVDRKTVDELYCSVELIRGVDGELIFLSALHIFLSVTALLGNTLILVALHKETSLHPPSKLLYRNLAITALCVGIILEPLYVTYLTSVVNERWDICYHAYWAQTFLSYILCAVSLVTSTAISEDRLLALLLGLRYRQVVTLRRTRITVIALWILSIISACTIFWNPLIFAWYQHIGTALCLVTTIFAYTKIFLTLRHNQIHVNPVQSHVFPGQPSQAIPLNIARYRKAVNSALWIQVTLVVCYLPFGIAVALTPQRGMPLSSYLARNFAGTIVYLNSSLNPFLYCWKMRQVRQAVKETLRQLFC
ncbi:unnamed protein product [Porites lobata]|uniref:G-protein coupled receptors family 1 profile domain-containing protein n=1 Tax=Porites lobata TaxID=104759 RepID=A0ABN8QS09_9CNID|nr:unnamed protein product [Porites lobata]